MEAPSKTGRSPVNAASAISTGRLGVAAGTYPPGDVEWVAGQRYGAPGGLHPVSRKLTAPIAGVLTDRSCND
jgi:hypothetical protein